MRSQIPGMWLTLQSEAYSLRDESPLGPGIEHWAHLATEITEITEGDHGFFPFSRFSVRSVISVAIQTYTPTPYNLVGGNGWN